MQRRNQVLADRRSRGWEPDENSPLIGGDRRETEDYDTVSYDNASQHSLPFMVRILKFTVDAITINLTYDRNISIALILFKIFLRHRIICCLQVFTKFMCQLKSWIHCLTREVMNLKLPL